MNYLCLDEEWADSDRLIATNLSMLEYDER